MSAKQSGVNVSLYANPAISVRDFSRLLMMA
jgi:hypothetical protein